MQAFVKLSENKGKLEDSKEDVSGKIEAMLAENERIDKKVRDLSRFLDRGSTTSAKEMLVRAVMPQNEVKKKLLTLESRERAIEDTISEVKILYRSKKIDLNTYLDRIRSLAEKQFKAIATQRKIKAIYG